MEIVHPPIIAAGGRKNTKPAGNSPRPATRLVPNNDDISVELRGEAMIKANGRLFKTTAAANKYVETFTFGEDRFSVQIETIENYKMKIATRSTAYAKLATKFLEDGSWRESKWTPKQFMELIEPLLAIKLTVSDIRDRGTLALQTITGNWGLPVAERIKAEVKGVWCLRQIASVSSLYKDNYENARHELNHRIINYILSKKSRQSAPHYASLMDWTSVLNSPNCHRVPSVITFQILQAARVYINGDGILKAGLSVPRKDAVDQQEDEEVEREKKKTSLRKNTSQSSTAPKNKIKRLKRSTKSTPVESSAKITIPPPKTNPPWSACLHCTNVHDIPVTWREEVESEEPIDLQQGMYLLAAFMYSQFKVCDRHYLLLCKRL